MNVQNRKITPEILFFMIALLGIAVMLASLLITGGGILPKMVYDESRFCDFWVHIGRLFNYGNPYGHIEDADAIFPPLAYCFLGLFARCMRLDGQTIDEYASTGFGVLVFAIYLLLFMTAFVQTLNYHYQTKNGVLKIIAPFVFLLSYPFWSFAFERGNLVIYAMLFLYIGLVLRNHPHKVMREISLVCVAISAGLKIYPALFGLLWIAEKRYKEAFRLVIYGVIAFFGPFIFYGGIHAFFDYMKIFSGYIGRGAYARTSIIGTCILFFGESGETIGKIAVCLWVAWVIACLFMERKVTWRVLAMLASTQTILIPESYVYTYVFIAIPCIFFLNEAGERIEKLDYLYAVLFACIFTVPFMPFLPFRVLFAMYICWMILLFVISGEKILRCHIWRKKV